MQLQDIRDEVRLRAGLGTNEGLFPDTVLTSLINSSIRRQTVMQDWPWLEVKGTVATVASTQTITIANRRKVNFLSIEGENLRRVAFRNLPDYYNRTGRPQYWTSYADVIYLLPTPDAVYTVDYGVIDDAETALSSDTDEPTWPDWAIDVIISDVCVLVARRKTDREMEARFFGEFRFAVENILDDIRLAEEGEVPRRTRESGTR